MTKTLPFEAFTPELVVAPGARAAERELLADVERLSPRGIPEPHAAPLRVLVPSDALRRHVCTRLIEKRGRTLAGVTVQTLSAFAREVLECAGDAPRTLDRTLFEVWVRREARAHPVLADLLALRHDSGPAIAASVNDLLDAGLDDSSAEALLGAPELRTGGAAARRAEALIRCAAALRRALDDFVDESDTGEVRTAYARRGDRLQRAAERLRELGTPPPPARRVLIHGFADLTGVAIELVGAVCSRIPTTFYLDSPPASDARAGESRERFTARLRERLALAPRAVAAAAEPVSTRRLVAAGSPETEVRALCQRIRAEIDEGRAPESIGVVTRQPRLYAASLRRHFERLGIPYSAPGFPGPAPAGARGANALVDLFRNAARTASERWLDALGSGARIDVTFELRHGLRVLGAGRLGDVAALDLEAQLARATKLRIGVPADPDENGDPRETRSVARELLESARDLAAETLESLAGLARPQPALRALESARGLIVGTLGWNADDPVSGRVLRALDEFGGHLPRRERLDGEELAMLVEGIVESAIPRDLAGSGSGVRVSDVLNARGQTFESLHLIGLVRDVFPRRISEDPLFLDDLREPLSTRRPSGVLQAILPDLPLKSRGYEEERYLFDMLIAASRQVTLSWHTHDVAGREIARSPLLSRIPGFGDEGAIDHAPPLNSVAGLDAPLRPHTAFELALLVGLDRRRDELAPFLVAAHEEARAFLDRSTEHLPPPADLAAAQLDALVELDDASTRSLGPFVGLVGSPAIERAEIGMDHATSIEALLRCPWQAFLRKALRLAPTPDPLADLPGPSPLLVGAVVHSVLQRVVSDALGARGPVTIQEALEAQPFEVAEPSRARLEELATLALESVAREEGLALTGRRELLLALCMEVLSSAFARVGPLNRVLGVEVRGGFTLESGREVRFRADRVDLGVDGSLVLIDYKTSARALSSSGTPGTIRKHLLKAIARGRSLQGAVYALATPAGAGRGLYAYVDPEVECEAPGLSIEGGDPALREETTRVVESALAAWDAGELPPRVVDASGQAEPRGCSWCDLQDACRRGESGARRRLVAWGETGAGSQEAGRRLWRVEAEQPGDF